MDLPMLDQAEICQGATRPRTLLGIPTSVSMGLLISTALLVYIVGWGWLGWLVIGSASLLGGWLRWQTKLDPWWMRKWWAATRHPQQYR